MQQCPRRRQGGANSGACLAQSSNCTVKQTGDGPQHLKKLSRGRQGIDAAFTELPKVFFET